MYNESAGTKQTSCELNPIPKLAESLIALKNAHPVQSFGASSFYTTQNNSSTINQFSNSNQYQLFTSKSNHLDAASFGGRNQTSSDFKAVTAKGACDEKKPLIPYVGFSNESHPFLKAPVDSGTSITTSFAPTVYNPFLAKPLEKNLFPVNSNSVDFNIFKNDESDFKPFKNNAVPSIDTFFEIDGRPWNGTLDVSGSPSSLETSLFQPFENSDLKISSHFAGGEYDSDTVSTNMSDDSSSSNMSVDLPPGTPFVHIKHVKPIKRPSELTDSIFIGRSTARRGRPLSHHENRKSYKRTEFASSSKAHVIESVYHPAAKKLLKRPKSQSSRAKKNPIKKPSKITKVPSVISENPLLTMLKAPANIMANLRQGRSNGIKEQIYVEDSELHVYFVILITGSH